MKAFLFRDLLLTAVLVGSVVVALSGAEPRQAAVGQVGAVAASAEPLTPIAPETVSRDDAGRVVVRAIRLASPIRLDGKLDEAVYNSERPISGFLQSLPKEGAPATERTEAWVMFDGESIYVAGRCWDSAPPDQWIANDMRRDSQQLRDNDNFGVMFDTFHDRRNAFTFYTNPLGALADQTFTDEGNPNRDWNAVWSVRTGRFDGGWTVEMAIPFKSLRYTSGPAQVWGVNLRRTVRRKNEFSHLTTLSGAQGGSQAWFRVSGAATLVGLDLPPASANIELKPYGVSSLTTDRVAVPAVSNHIDKDFGADAKYGINANLTADLTYNTDFAQVEVDEQQVNLTRFSLLFPEKREFFLEGRGIFDFGRGGSTSGPQPGGNAGGTSLTPNLFYSRRIGLNRGRVVPIDLGGRITGKIGKVGLGVLNIQAGDESLSSTPPTNYTVVRLKQDILKRSSIGVMLTNRSESVVAGGGSNQAYGADAAFSFFENVNLGGYYAKSATPTLEGEDDSYQARLDYGADRYGARIEYLKVGDDFNPEVGFVRRHDIYRTFGSLRFSPRPRALKAVRQFTWEAAVEYIENGAGQLESRSQTGRFNVERENSDQFSIEGGTSYELLLLPFEVAREVTLAPGGYDFNDATVRYVFGPQRRTSGTASLQLGQFYDGTIIAYGFTTARMSVTNQLSIEPSVSINHVDITAGTFITKVLRARTDYAFSPRMFASALLQFSSNDTLFSSNLRLRWEYRPGSELFVVYTDERETRLQGFPDLKNRSLIVKLNRLLRF